MARIGRQETMEKILIDNIGRVHTTAMGIERIKRNIGIDDIDVVAWCKDKILAANVIERRGKNWYVHADGYVVTINASSYTVITVHKKGKILI